MERVNERVSVPDIEAGAVYVVQEHVDATQVVGRYVQFLPEETVPYIFLPEYFRELQQQRSGAAGGIVYLVDIPAVVADNAGKQFADFLRREGLTAAFSGV